MALKALQRLTLISFMASSSTTPHSTFTSTISSIWFPFQGKPFSLLRKPPGEQTQPTPVAALPAIQTPLLLPTAFCFSLYISIYHILVTSVSVCLLWMLHIMPTSSLHFQFTKTTWRVHEMFNNFSWTNVKGVIPAWGFDTSAAELMISTSIRPLRAGTQTYVSVFPMPAEHGHQRPWMDSWVDADDG